MKDKVWVSRREVLRTMAGAGVALPLVAAGHPILAHLANVVDAEDSSLSTVGWTPRFLTAEQNKTLISLAEAIVPGSRDAGVNRFIDLLLSVDTKKNQTAFIEALQSLDSAATKQHGKSFSNLSAEAQTLVLTNAAEKGPTRSQEDGTSQPQVQNSAPDVHSHFENLKGWVAGAYYSSELGMKELGWTPNRVFAHFPPCEHPDDHA
jgi:hypothetical protein